MTKSPVFLAVEKKGIYENCDNIVKSMRTSRYSETSDSEKSSKIDSCKGSESECHPVKRRGLANRAVEKNNVMM